MNPKCPDHPTCSICGAELEYIVLPSGSGMLETVGCPNHEDHPKKAGATSLGINAIMHFVCMDEKGTPLCGYLAGSDGSDGSRTVELG